MEPRPERKGNGLSYVMAGAAALMFGALILTQPDFLPFLQSMEQTIASNPTQFIVETGVIIGGTALLSGNSDNKRRKQ